VPFGVAFGVAATGAGLSLAEASAFSLLVFAGSAQFAAIEIIGRGGGAVPAIAAGLLLNLRCLAFGIVMAPSLPGPWWKRALWSHLMIDESTAVATVQRDPRWRRYGFGYAGLAIFVAWNISTVVGAAARSSTGHLVTTAGIDATIPAAFLALLWPRLGDARQRLTAVLGGLVALALVPLAAPGIPVIAAGAVVGITWWRAKPEPAS
jgi:predicted branched-subunit amino acid permease